MTQAIAPVRARAQAPSGPPRARLLAALAAALALGGCFGSGRCTGSRCDTGSGSSDDAAVADGQCGGTAAGTFSNSPDPVFFSPFEGVPTPLSALAGRVTLNGSLALTGTSADELQSLRCLEVIEGALLIEDSAELTDLRGLERLRAVRSLSINNNEGLTSLQGLAQDLIDSGGVLVVEELTLLENRALTDAQALFAHLETTTLRLVGTQLRTLPMFSGHSAPFSVELDDNALADLAGLRGVTEIGSLLITEHGLSDLSDLADLQRVTNLIIRSNGLTDLTGLGSLRVVESDLRISGEALTSLRGLDSLRLLGGELDLDHLPRLTDLSGLEAITSVGGLRLAVLGDLFSPVGPRSLHGLEGLEEVFGNVTIHSNHSLQTLQGLDNLVRVTGALQIITNRQLTDLRGLEALRHVAAELTILDNDKLTSLRALDRELQVDQLLVLGNPALPHEEANALATRVGRACTCDVANEQPCACTPPCACSE